VSVDQPVFNFDFGAFFSFEKFCTELTQLAEFLDQTFFPDTSLYNLWAQFMQYNQGWQSYIKCDQILQDIFAINISDIDCTVIEQGWLNYKLSKICKIYNGSMFEGTQYPAHTQLVYSEICNHLAQLR
jgi:hypothetical protein